MIRPTLDNTLGSALIGTVLSACLFGVTTQQTVTYYRLSGQDHIVLKLLVGLLWALDIAHVALLIQIVYEYAVSNFGNILGLEKYNSNVVVVFLFTGLSDFIIRGIYQHKIWALSNRNRPLCAFLATMAVVTFGSNIVITVKSSRCHPCEWAYIDKLAWIVYFLLGMITISDIVISATLCFFLGDQVRESHSNRLNRAVRTLQVYIINAGIMTSVCSLLTLILYAVGPDTQLKLILLCILPKLFLNALLAMLNARKSIRSQMGNGGAVVSVHMATTTETDRCSDSGDLESGRGQNWGRVRMILPKGP